MRTLLFSSIIYKDVSWFDSKDKAPGVLSNILAEDITLLNGLSTETVAIYMEGSMGFIIGIIMAFTFTWKMSLITLALCPFMMLGGILRSRLGGF